ncbi:hypothetical protein [Patulibacter sp. SYSU D01012]|uniref:hypothetical protein n=1 Tax=Patulibacter sp. SYSU D01012 TaxID=2817381 RepID=UPI001B30E82E|nr:hypothetical protein [Patulibacter sp. SYSU D01012]
MRAPWSRRAAVAACALALGGGAAGCGQASRFPADDPRSAVNQLLIAAIAQANGQRACSLLTVRARERFDAGPAGSCRAALNTAISSMPGPYNASDDAGQAADGLIYTLRKDGPDRATVTARRGRNPALTFRVVRLSPREREADEAGSEQTVGGGPPDTEWRVDVGAEQLLEVDPTQGQGGTGTTDAPAPSGA